VKSARFGYDGKGQIRVAQRPDVIEAFRAMGQACVVEALLDLACEVSVIVARTDDGACVTWPVAENRHRNGILDVSIVPAQVRPAVAAHARDVATRVASALDYRGILCVEMFVTRAGELLVNELAPRPHNSGHYTIDACVTSQFEQQARVLAGLPLGDTRQHQPAVMVNLLGDVWFPPGSDVQREPDWSCVLRHAEAKLHLYGKREARRGRKMGHVTCLAPTLDQARDAARAIRRDLGMAGADAL
jgi:5-(carboxyamino)imidazole ribonucleotide synthase